MTTPRAVDDENNPWIDRWPTEHAEITVDDGYDRDVWHLYGPNGEILSTWSIVHRSGSIKANAVYHDDIDRAR